MQMTEKVFLIDGSGYIFRAYYAITPLTTSTGFPTNALYGFTRMLLKLLRECSPSHLAVVFDAGEPTFRHKLYDQYKANRLECPEDLKKQMPIFRDLARALGLPVFEKAGFEADDIIGTLTKQFRQIDFDVVIVSGDKDLLQLINQGVKVWDTMKDVWYGPKEVRDKLGVDPEQVVEYLGLTGDSSDNIPGLKGVGPKTALQLIESYKDVATILQSVDSIKQDSTIRNRNKIAAEIENNGELLKLSRQLVVIDCDMQLDFNEARVNGNSDIGSDLLSVTACQQPDGEALARLVEQLEFASLFKELNLDVGAKNQVDQQQVEFLTVWPDQFGDWYQMLSKQSEVSFDLETDSLDVLQAQIVGLSFCWSATEAYYLPVAHVGVEAVGKQIPWSELSQKLRPFFEDPQIRKCGQNLKFDYSVLRQHGIETVGISFDSMIAAYLINPDKSSYSLDVLVPELLGKRTLSYKEVVGDLKNFAAVDISAATDYACADAHNAWMLKEKLAAQISENGLEKLFTEIEMPLVTVLAEMECRGIKLDCELLAGMSSEFEGRLKELQAEIYRLAGCEFNTNSPKQLSDVLFNRLGISTKGLKRTKQGTSTDSSVLEKLTAQHPLPRVLLEYRMVHKLKSTYVDALAKQLSPITSRLHSRFNQTVTGTGRLSSSDPNLQNIPIHSKEGNRIRKAFVAESGNILISADYSQIELRLLAHMSGDSNLIEAFQADQDIHAKTAREILGLAADQEISSEQRRMGKTINFGVIYGMSGFRLGGSLGIPVNVANNYITEYFNRYPAVKGFYDQLINSATEQGFVTTMFGRRRVIGSVDTRGRDRNFLARVAVNAPIQGSAADLIKLAMVKLARCIKSSAVPLHLLVQVHDELLFECPSDFREDAFVLIREQMESVMSLKVPLKVDIGWGVNWQEAHG